MEENRKPFRETVEELYKKGKFEEILEFLTDEVLKKENDAALYAWKARTYKRLGFDDSITILFSEKAISMNPSYFLGYFTMALVWSDINENDKAIANYTKALDIKPDFADAYYNRGVCWQMKKENEKANADYDKAILIYNKNIEYDPEYIDAYFGRGNTWYNKKEYDKAIEDYTKIIEIKSDSEIALALYSRGLAWVAKKEYDKAIADYSKAIETEPNFVDACYNDRGLALKAKGQNKEAIKDYTKAIEINPNFANAYYNRGLANKEKDYDPKEIKHDFEKYLELATNINEVWAKYAKYYIEDLNEEIEDPELALIRQLVNEIKGQLMIKEECVTHYTTFSVLKKLILEESKFQISEGNFMNDPSEGTEFFKFLKYKPFTSRDDGSSAETFTSKPFIGSFVTKDKHNDLNLWRFYGKEEGVEAKGCAITLRTQEFIEDIKSFITNEESETRQDDESDINFYRVAYVSHRMTNFYIPNSDKSKELSKIMTKLKERVKSYQVKDKTSLEKYLNSIAFLFKSDAYKNENEVRLVVKGIEFEKKYRMDLMPPKVYIELEPIKRIVSQITLGPKVDKVNEWASTLHYIYKENAPTIIISHLPYK
jgi:tetratricopeptide (TPR) repeat protein